MALLDEAMVTVTTGQLMPFSLGIVYCGALDLPVGVEEWTRR